MVSYKGSDIAKPYFDYTNNSEGLKEGINYGEF